MTPHQCVSVGADRAHCWICRQPLPVVHLRLTNNTKDIGR